MLHPRLVTQLQALVWFEESFNFGDAAIWKGQVRLLRELGASIEYTCSDKTYNKEALSKALGISGTVIENDQHNKKAEHTVPESKAPPLIVIRGGGNFGDIYSYHGLRLTICRDFPHVTIIGLPQSVHFRYPENIPQTQRFLNRPHLTLIARDQASLRFFQVWLFCPRLPEQTYFPFACVHPLFLIESLASLLV